MKGQRFQFIILAVICAICAGGFFLIKNMSFTEPAETTETTVTDFNPEDVTALTVTGGNELHFVKEDGVWTESSLPGETIDEGALTILLRQISSITTTETVVEDAEDLNQYGLEEPYRTIEAQLSDGSTITVRAGSENSLLSKYYVQVDENPSVYLISSYIVTDFDKTAEEFIQEETNSASETAEENAAETDTDAAGTGSEADKTDENTEESGAGSEESGEAE